MRRAVLLALSLAACARAEAAPAMRGPWLQGLTENEVTVKVELPIPEALKLEVKGGGAVVTARGGAKRFHALTVRGLLPKTAYTYELGRDGTGEVIASGSFASAPKVDEAKFSFLLYGDSRTDDDAHRAVVEAMRKVPSDFLVNTGDLVAHGDDEDDWASFFAAETPLLKDRCVFASVGNHELTNRSLEGSDLPFLRYFGPIRPTGNETLALHGSFRWGTARFFLLNAMDAWTGDQKRWLASELESAKNEKGLLHRIAVLHHGPFASGPHGPNPRIERERIAAMLRDGGIDLVVSGHDHIYERGAHEGLKYVVSGGSGAPLYPIRRKHPGAALVDSVHHFVHVEIDGPKLALTMHRAAGGVGDQASYAGKDGWKTGADEVSAAPAPAAPPPISPMRAGCSCDVGSAAPAGGSAAVLAGLLLLALRRRAARG